MRWGGETLFRTLIERLLLTRSQILEVETLACMIDICPPAGSGIEIGADVSRLGSREESIYRQGSFHDGLVRRASASVSCASALASDHGHNEPGGGLGNRNRRRGGEE